MTLAILVLGGNDGAGGDLADVEAVRSQPNGPRRGGKVGGGAWTGGVETPEEAEETEPRLRMESSTGTGVGPLKPVDVVSVASEDRLAEGSCAVSSNDTSVRSSFPSAPNRCWYLRGDFSRLREPFPSLRVSVLFVRSMGSAGSEAGVIVLDVASTKSSAS